MYFSYLRNWTVHCLKHTGLALLIQSFFKPINELMLSSCEVGCLWHRIKMWLGQIACLYCMLLKEIPEYLFHLHFLFLVCSSMFPHHISLQTLFHTTKFLATRLVTSIFITSRTQWYVKQYIKLKFTYISFPEHDPEIKHLMMLKCVLFCFFTG